MLTLITYIVFIVNVYHAILNPFGQIGDLPVKTILLIILIICLAIGTLFQLFYKEIKAHKSQWRTVGVFCFCIVYLFVVNGLIGLAKGNNPNYIFDNLNGYFFTFVIAFSIWFLTNKGIELNSLIHHFVIATTIVSIFSITILISYRLMPSLHASLVDIIFQYKMGSAFPYGGFIRLFMKSQIYSLAIAVVLLIRYLKNHNRTDIALMVVNLIPPFFAFTRSFWFSFIIVIVLFYLLDSRLGKVSKKKTAAIVVMFALFLGFVSIPIVNNRLLSSFSADEIGNAIRTEQYNYTKEYLRKDILFGMGAGGEYFNQTYAIESTYHDALARYGVIGFSFLVVLITYPMFSVILRYGRFNKNPPLTDYFSIGYFIVILVSITNPFLLSSLGMLYLGFLYGIMLTPQYI